MTGDIPACRNHPTGRRGEVIETKTPKCRPVSRTVGTLFLVEPELSAPRFSVKRRGEPSVAAEEFPPLALSLVCGRLGVAVLLPASANWSECTKNSSFLGNLSTSSGKMNVLRMRGCHSRPASRGPTWVMHAAASQLAS